LSNVALNLSGDVWKHGPKIERPDAIVALREPDVMLLERVGETAADPGSELSPRA